MKHKFIAKRYWKDRTTAMGQADVLAKTFDDVIDLSLGDPDWTTDRRIIRAAFCDAEAGHTKYTDFRGDPELREAIADYYQEEFNVGVADEEVMVTASGCLAMYLVLEAIVDDGDEVILHAPYFTPYPQQIELARGVPVVLDTCEEEEFQINAERLEQLVTERTKAIVINTPNNPSGSCFTEETLRRVADIAKKYDLLVIADEIYSLFSFRGAFMSMLQIEGMKERTVVINSYSKDYLMTGWRVGQIVAPGFIVRTIQTINENVVFTAPSISQRAALYALRHRKELQPPIKEEYRKRVFYAAKRVNRIPNMSVLEPRGTFYLFLNVKKTGLTSEQASETILRQAHVLTLPGAAFGSCGEGYLRIACTVGRKELEEAFDRMERLAMFQR